MSEEMKQRLQQAGVDVEELSGRFMGNEALMVRFLGRFPQDQNYAQLEQALEKGDAAGAYAAAHTLKGVTGNLSLKKLYQSVCEVVEPLRKEDLEGAKAKMSSLREVYSFTVGVIEQELKNNG